MVKLQDWLEKHIHQDYAYSLVSGLVMAMQTALLLWFGYLFDCIPFIIVSTFILNGIRNYSGGLHLGNTLRCTILTSMLIIISGYISVMSTSHLWALFLLYLYCVRDLYLRAPISNTDVDLQLRWYNTRPFIYIWKLLRINTTKYDKPYDIVRYRKGVVKWIVISLFFSIIFLYLELYYLQREGVNLINCGGKRLYD